MNAWTRERFTPCPQPKPTEDLDRVIHLLAQLLLEPTRARRDHRR